MERRIKNCWVGKGRSRKREYADAEIKAVYFNLLPHRVFPSLLAGTKTPRSLFHWLFGFLFVEGMRSPPDNLFHEVLSFYFVNSKLLLFWIFFLFFFLGHLNSEWAGGNIYMYICFYTCTSRILLFPTTTILYLFVSLCTKLLIWLTFPTPLPFFFPSTGACLLLLYRTHYFYIEQKKREEVQAIYGLLCRF